MESNGHGKLVRRITFDVAWIIDAFEQPGLKRSVDKGYEVIVYALFDSIVRHLKANVTLSIDPAQAGLLKDFSRFAQLVLGLDEGTPSLSMPARLYRVGSTNAADAGLDMWANFGPAIQVKHLTLTAVHIEDITDRILADQIVIVCKKAEQPVLNGVTSQLGLANRIRGFITEVDLIEWYALCKTTKYVSTLGRDVLKELKYQFDLEFPQTNSEELDAFYHERGYRPECLVGVWVPEKV